jgi:hypothetical protein
MWKHREGSGRPGDRATDVAPPRIFRRLAFEFGDSDSFNAHPVGFVPGPGERFYRADITPAEVLWCEADQHGTSTQDVLDKAVLEPSRELLNRELGVPVLPIPVLWDQVPDLSEYAEGKTRTPTSSFSPDCANLQLLNGHLVVPKPYGPRMRASDAVTAVRAVMKGVAGLEAARARVGPRLVAQRRMAQETYWVQRRDGAVDLSPSGIVRRSYGGLRDLDDLADVFRDSFPGESRAQVTRRLSRANGGLVDGRGLLRREFSRVVVRDGMVDLFELFIAAVVDQLGLTLHFVDSWYYHLHLGQIHCGTNVLRRPSRAGRPHVWDVADWEGFRSQTMTFEDEPVPVR